LATALVSLGGAALQGEYNMDAVKRVLKSLQAGGLLLMQDKTFPSVVSLVTGEQLSRSWWSHPCGNAIFRCLCDLQAHPDVLETKLLAGKVTFVHRRLWPAVLAVAQAREPWQLKDLPPRVRALWDQVQHLGSVIDSGPVAKEVESRLLAHGNQVHTDAGRHKTRLETWQEWSQRVGCTAGPSSAEGRTELEEAVVALGGKVQQLPWYQARLAKGSRQGIKGDLHG
jgi:hypothetical protein